MKADATVYLVDDDPSLRVSLERLLRSAGLHCVSFASPEEFISKHDDDQPGCVVLDVMLPQQNGLALYEALRSLPSPRSAVFISGQHSVDNGVRAMKAGAIDFLVKPFEDEVFLAAVRRALDDDARRRQVRAEKRVMEARLISLTGREREVFAHVVRGRLNKQIAAELGTSEKTIKVHRARAMEKMGARSLAELVRISIEVCLPDERNGGHCSDTRAM